MKIPPVSCVVQQYESFQEWADHAVGLSALFRNNYSLLRAQNTSTASL